MPSAIATGSYTIVDYNDAPLLSGWINVKGSKTQGYNPDTATYVPDYSNTPLALSACLFVSGTSSDLLDHPEGIISEMQWEVTDSIGVTNVITGANSRTYSINTNLTTDHSKTYTFKCMYTQPASKLAIPVVISVDINKVINGTGIADAVIMAPNGNCFKNENSNELTLECQLWSGSILDPDVDETSYLWWKMDSQGQGGSHGIGAGWRMLFNGVKGYKIEYRNKTSVLTVPNSDVFSSAVYMCTVYCTAKGHEEVFKETISILDSTDPIMVEFDSPGGDVFKNGNGSTVLTAVLRQNAQEIDPVVSEGEQQKYEYKWYKYDRNGDLVDKSGNLSDGTIPYHIGKQLQVTSDDVYEKATFKCEIY